ncbi:MAG: radical SAM protein [Desulfobacteraceae bacterium]|nr:radical SAM protein [Desulfobacteraceae bacterium]
MRPSCYLNAVEIGDGNSLLYNGFSMCIDILPTEIATRLVASSEGGALSFLTPAEREHLAKRGHLTRKTVKGEREAIGKLARAIAERDLDRNRQPDIGRILTFILTYKCNLSCTYCFQSRVRKASHLPSMSEAFVEGFFDKHLDSLFPNAAKDRLRFILFGGEPMLPGNRLTIERILRYAKEHGIVVSTTTNGVMLPRMLDLIGAARGKINSVQVTLDGGRRFHDENRVTRSGAPTFEKTVRALSHVVSAGARAIVRIHLHPGRLEAARVLIEYLEREKILGHDSVEVYFAPVHAFHAGELSSSDSDVFSALFQHVALIQKKPPIQNFDFLEQMMNVRTIENWSQPRYCAVSTGLHYAVDPLGDIYECLEEAGFKDRRVGTLAGGELEFFELRDIYRKRYLENMPECLQCSIALFCGGGCISRTRTHGGSAVKNFCLQNKLFVAQTLRSCYLVQQVEQAEKRAASSIH